MTTKIEIANISQAALTTLAGSGTGGPKITSVVVTDSSYNTVDDTAVNLSGGYIKITGSGFASGCQVLVGTTTATSVTFVSSTEVRAQVPATVAGTYVVYLVNSDGGVAIRVNGISFSATPTWTTSSTFTGAVNSAISTQLLATGATTFALASGSSLPSGLSLSSGGLLSGTITGITQETTYNFTVVATDAELQDSPQAFALTITVGDPLFRYNTLLLSANGANNSHNNTFLDSSTNNYTITRNGTPAQGTFSPYGNNWSAYFDGAGDYIRKAGTGVLTASGDLTIECWIYPLSTSVIGLFDGGPTETGCIRNYPANSIAKQGGEGTAAAFTVTANTWQHFACTFTGGNIKVYINGTLNASGTYQSGYIAGSNFDIGGINSGGDGAFNGYISNFRVTKSVVYTTTFTPSITPLTNLAETSLLTCQSNRFKDSSTNNFALSKVGDTSVQRFSPFNSTAGYSTSGIGGSIRFANTVNSAANVSATLTGANAMTTWTMEMFCYAETSSITDQVILGPWNPNLIRVSGGQLQIYLAGNNYFNLSNALPVGQWNHLAICSDSTNLRVYVNGVRLATAGSSNVSINMTDLVLGAQATTSATNDRWPGYISDFRVLNGTALYTDATCTIPTLPLTAITNTKILLSGTNSNIADSTMMNNLETVGDVKNSTTQSKFGGSSIYFDGSGDYLSISSRPNLNLGSGNFTIEMWAYLTTGGNFTLFNKSNSYQLKTDSSRWVWQALGVTNVIVQSGDLTTNTWTHVALVRNGSLTTIYLNGTAVATGTSANCNDSTSPLQIGYGDATFTGYIDDFRFTKGLARYTANFTPPAAASLTQ